MGPLAHAINDLKFRVNPEILRKAFIKRDYHSRKIPLSIDDAIMSAVIRPRVFVDCNLIGGIEDLIPLTSAVDRELIDNVTTVFSIPKSLTQGRSIMSVLNLTYADPTSMLSQYGTSAQCGSSAFLQGANAVASSFAEVPNVSNARLRLIGENVVMVENSVIPGGALALRCILANDENLSNISIRNYRNFAKMVELAVKSYIYNEYVITMDSGEMQGGVTLGRFKEIIDSYSDAEEMYQTYLTEKMGKIFVMNDQTSMTRYMQRLIGGAR